MSAVDIEQPTLQCLLRAELSAVEAYVQIFDTFEALPALDELIALRHSHSNATRNLGLELYRLGVSPDTSQPMWGCWADLISRLSLLDSRYLFESLLPCERLEEAHYLVAAQDPKLNITSRAVIEKLHQAQQQRSALVLSLVSDGSSRDELD